MFRWYTKQTSRSPELKSRTEKEGDTQLSQLVTLSGGEALRDPVREAFCS